LERHYRKSKYKPGRERKKKKHKEKQKKSQDLPNHLARIVLIPLVCQLQISPLHQVAKMVQMVELLFHHLRLQEQSLNLRGYHHDYHQDKILLQIHLHLHLLNHPNHPHTKEHSTKAH
jgi:hypothetical protein